jgi:opacity protein-like surface antigen
MQKIVILASSLLLLTGAAVAQSQNPPANQGPGNPAINKSDGNNPGAPVAGANSFTEGQAKSRIESNGYSNVTALQKDDAGVWRGKAQRNGKSVDVSLDFQGNVVAK